jgi:ankyrin repeat protein
VLLKLGADPNAQAQGDLWECPLHVAVRGRFTACVKVLLDFGADVNAMNQFKETPLHVAAEVSSVNRIAYDEIR